MGCLSVSTARSVQLAHIGGYASVQDLGRKGYRAIGVPVSGALDSLSAVYANALVGNEPKAAVIEVFGTISIKLSGDSVVAVTGGYPRVFVDNLEVKPWTPVYCRHGTTLRVAPSGIGRVHYVAISGGIICEEVLGSMSTYARGAMGCLGRPLKLGDVLEIGYSDSTEIWGKVADLKPPDHLVSRHSSFEGPLILRSTEGIHRHLLDDLETLLRSDYVVTTDSDRMGYRLDGEPLSSAKKLGRLPSIPTDKGYVQVPPDGKPIVLMSDAQTTGGYAVALHVFPQDADLLAQLNPGQKARFRLIGWSEAEAEVRKYLDEIERPVLRREEPEYWT